jgi:hypothetical protein
MMFHGTVFVLLITTCPILASNLVMDFNVCPTQGSGMSGKLSQVKWNIKPGSPERQVADTIHDTYGFDWYPFVDTLLMVVQPTCQWLDFSRVSQVPNFPVTWEQDHALPTELLPEKLPTTLKSIPPDTKIDLAAAAAAMDSFMKLPEVVSRPDFLVTRPL